MNFLISTHDFMELNQTAKNFCWIWISLQKNKIEFTAIFSWESKTFPPFLPFWHDRILYFLCFDGYAPPRPIAPCVAALDWTWVWEKIFAKKLKKKLKKLLNKTYSSDFLTLSMAVEPSIFLSFWSLIQKSDHGF